MKLNTGRYTFECLPFRPEVEDHNSTVQFPEDVYALFKPLDEECDANINAHDATDISRTEWHHAHLRALQLTALMALDADPAHPVARKDHALMAITIVRDNIARFLNHKEAE